MYELVQKSHNKYTNWYKRHSMYEFVIINLYKKITISFFRWCSYFMVYIKWALMCDDCKPFWSRVEIPTRRQIFFLLIFVYID